MPFNKRRPVLPSRSVTVVVLPWAARNLPVASVKTLIRHSELEEDDRFHGGFQSVTRVSLETYLRRGRRRPRS